MKNKRQLPVRKDFGRSKVKNFESFKITPNHYVIAFCYQYKGKDFVVKGDNKRVRSYIASVNRPMYVCFLTYMKYSQGKYFNSMTYDFVGMDKRYKVMIDGYHNPDNDICSRRLRRSIVVFDLESGEKIIDKEIRRAPISWPHDIDIYVDRIFRRSIEAVKAARQVYHSSKSIIEETMA